MFQLELLENSSVRRTNQVSWDAHEAPTNRNKKKVS